MYGLNLSVPEDARAVIKPWDERDDTAKFADSSVDDQVGPLSLFCVACKYVRVLPRRREGYHPYTVHTKC